MWLFLSLFTKELNELYDRNEQIMHDRVVNMLHVLFFVNLPKLVLPIVFPGRPQ